MRVIAFDPYLSAERAFDLGAECRHFPSITAEEAPKLRPFVALASYLRSFAGQLVDGGIEEFNYIINDWGQFTPVELWAVLHTPWLFPDGIDIKTAETHIMSAPC